MSELVYCGRGHLHPREDFYVRANGQRYPYCKPCARAEALARRLTVKGRRINRESAARLRGSEKQRASQARSNATVKRRRAEDPEFRERIRKQSRESARRAYARAKAGS